MPLSSVLGAQSLVRPGVCTSSTRPASPFEGQVIYETDTNRIVVYDGSAWVYAVDTDQPPGLQLIKTQTIGTAVSSVTVSDVFSADFDNYRVIVSGGAGSTNLILRMTLGATVTGYYYGGRGLTFANLASDGNGANVAYIPNGMGAASGLFGISDITSPFLAKETGFASIGIQMQTSGVAIPFNGYLNNTTSYTDFTITASTGTMTGGTIRVYGYRNS